MQKWEYLSVRTGVGDGSQRKVYSVNGREVPNWKKGADVWTYMNQLGLDGWEMVTSGNVGTFEHEIYFKRPK